MNPADTGLLIFICCGCKMESVACPECVNTILIDPETGLPPDVVILNGKAVRDLNPDPETVKRSRKQPICDHCITRRNKIIRGNRVLTSKERHERNHREQ